MPFADVMTPILFMVCGIFYCVAMLPTTLSTAASPQPLNTVKLDLPALFRNSPVSFMGILLVGIANGAFGTLGPVFGAAAGFQQGTIAVMMSVAILSGALMQLPAGRMSDRMDRRYVLAGLSCVAALSGLLFFVLTPFDVVWLLVLVGIYGAAANALYPIAVAHANDFASPEDFVKVSGGLLLLYGVGTIIGPSLGGPIMSAFGPYALFGVTAMAHILITAYAILRSRMRPPVPAGDRDAFTATGPMATPESLSLSPRAAPLPEGDSPEEQYPRAAI